VGDGHNALCCGRHLMYTTWKNKWRIYSSLSVLFSAQLTGETCSSAVARQGQVIKAAPSRCLEQGDGLGIPAARSRRLWCAGNITCLSRFWGQDSFRSTTVTRADQFLELQFSPSLIAAAWVKRRGFLFSGPYIRSRQWLLDSLAERA